MLETQFVLSELETKSRNATSKNRRITEPNAQAVRTDKRSVWADHVLTIF